MSSFLSITYLISHAGRIVIVDYVVYLIALIQVFQITMSRKAKRRILYFALIAFAVVIAMTASRRNIEVSSDFLKSSFIREVYDYFAIPIPQLSYWMEQIEESNTLSSGVGFFNGIIELPIRVLSALGLNAKEYYSIINEINATEKLYTHAAFNDKYYNAFVTAFFFFYADFRYIGVIIGSAVFGVAAGKIEKNYGNARFVSFVLYLMFIQSIARIFVRWQFYNLHYVFSFLYIYLLCGKRWRIKLKRESKAIGRINNNY